MGLSWSQSQSHDENEVAAFLARAGLQACTAALLRNGWDDMETLLAIEGTDMRDAGLSPQHAALLRGKLLEERRRREAGDGGNPVVAFLREVGMEQYAEALLRQGFDEMETLLLMQEADMTELGLPRGHVLKLKKRLREYEEGQHRAPQDGAEADSAAAPPADAAAAVTPAPAAGAPKKLLLSAAESWRQVKIVGLDAVGEMLRQNTLSLDPEAVALFRIPGVVSTGEGVLQRMALRHLFAKVVRFVGSVVTGRYDYVRLAETLTRLGATRAAGTAKEAHFEVLKRGLDLTLGQILGDAYTEEVQQAWMRAYSFNAAIMMEGLRTARGGAQAAAASKNEGSAGCSYSQALHRLAPFGA